MGTAFSEVRQRVVCQDAFFGWQMPRLVWVVWCAVDSWPSLILCAAKSHYDYDAPLSVYPFGAQSCSHVLAMWHRLVCVLQPAKHVRWTQCTSLSRSCFSLGAGHRCILGCRSFHVFCLRMQRRRVFCGNSHERLGERTALVCLVFVGGCRCWLCEFCWMYWQNGTSNAKSNLLDAMLMAPKTLCQLPITAAMAGQLARVCSDSYRVTYLPFHQSMSIASAPGLPSARLQHR